MDRFEDLLTSLSVLMKTPLAPDGKSTCLLVFENLVKIQLEVDSTGEFLVLGSLLGELPAGRFREQILTEALKQNINPEFGIFSFSLKKNQLALFIKLSFASVEVNALHTLLLKMVERAHPWIDAIAHGNVPQVEISPAATATTSIFGIKR